MSDIQEPLVVLQHRMQQRQILAMMGINQWVQPSSETINIADISAPVIPDSLAADSMAAAPIKANASTASYSTASSATTAQPSIESSNAEFSNAELSNIEPSNIDAINVAMAGMADDASIDHYYDAHEAGSIHSDQQRPVTYSFDSTAPEISKPAVTSLVETVVQQTALDNVNDAASFEGGSFKDDGFKKVAPFDLQGGRYGDWVVLVDIQALNHDSQKLWKNITQVLSIACETTSFPICEGMDTAELANASFAGYVFKIGRSEEIKVLALTALPDGLEHSNLTATPTLDEMLLDSRLKRTLWEMISGATDL